MVAAAYSLTNTGEWKVRPEINHARFDHAAAVYTNKIFIAGGNLSGESFPTVGSRSVEWFDDKIDKWKDGPNMNVRRVRFSLLIVDSTLFAVGGDECQVGSALILKYKYQSSQRLFALRHTHPSNYLN